MKTNAKENLLFLVFAVFLAVSGWAADAANDLLIMQRNSSNDDNVQRNVTAGYGYTLTFNSTYVPVSSSALVLPYTGSANITLTPAATGAISLQGPVVVGSPTGGAPSSGVINAAGLKINGVDVASSSDTYWNSDAPGIKYVAGPVSLKGTPTGDAGDMQVEDLTADSINGTVTLGTSGPQLSSSLAARAPAPGLCFSGEAGATCTSTPATGSFTVSAFVNASSFGSSKGVFSGTTGAFSLFIDSTGHLVSATANQVGNTASTGVLTAGKTHHVAYVCDSNADTGTYYIDGVAAGTTADTLTYGNITLIGAYISYDAFVFTGTISRSQVFNRALSAAEITSLAETGAAAGADYNSASNTTLLTGAWTNSGDAQYDYDTLTSASGAALAATYAGGNTGGAFALAAPTTFTAAVGQRFLVSFSATLNSGTAPKLSFDSPLLSGNKSNIHTVTAGANAAILTATASGALPLYFWNSPAESTDFALTGISVTRLGLLLSPDYSVGSGLTVPAQVGTSGTITLPASGVTWSVPNGNLISLGTTAGSQATIAGDSAGGLTVTPKNGQGLTLTTASPGGTTFTHKTTRTAANSRSWGFAINETSEGAWELMQSTTNSDAPSVSRFRFDVNGNPTFTGNLTASGTINQTRAVSGNNDLTVTNTTVGQFPSRVVAVDGQGRTAFFSSPDTVGNAQFGTTTGQDVEIVRAGARQVFIGNDNAIFGTGGNTVTLSAGAVTATGNVTTSSTTAFYLGDSATDGSWRFIRSGNNLVVERRESGSWVNKGQWTP